MHDLKVRRASNKVCDDSHDAGCVNDTVSLTQCHAALCMRLCKCSQTARAAV